MPSGLKTVSFNFGIICATLLRGRRLILLCAMLSCLIGLSPSGGIAAAPGLSSPWTNQAATTFSVFLPLQRTVATGCAPIPGANYATWSVAGPPTDRPAEQHADLNLALRGYTPISAYLGLIHIDGPADAGAPQLATLFADRRAPIFTRAYQIYHWEWENNTRGLPIQDPRMTLAGLAAAAGEVIYLADSGYDIGNGYEALVLYASEERLTLKYTREDNVVRGYALHVEGICVEPRLLALYRASDLAGRGQLPALRAGQPVGRARGADIRVAIRDNGRFLDPRSRKDWWSGYAPFE